MLTNVYKDRNTKGNESTVICVKTDKVC